MKHRAKWHFLFEGDQIRFSWCREILYTLTYVDYEKAQYNYWHPAYKQSNRVNPRWNQNPCDMRVKKRIFGYPQEVTLEPR